MDYFGVAAIVFAGFLGVAAITYASDISSDKENIQITEMVKSGADPIKASCAVKYVHLMCSEFNGK